MRRLLKVTGTTAVLTLLRMVIGIVITKVVAVYTGPTGMAMLGQVQSLVASFNGIINAPVGNGVVRYTAENKDKGLRSCAPWWRAALQWVILISVICMSFGLFFAKDISNWLLHDETLSWVVVSTVCVLPLVAIGTVCNSVINGKQQYRRYVGLGIISTLVSSVVMLFMISQYGIKGALLATAIQSALVGLVVLIFNCKQPWLKFKYWFGVTSNIERRVIGKYILMAVTSALCIPISLIIIRNFLVAEVGWNATGEWQAVWKISQVYLAVITTSLSTYYLPRLSSITGVDAIVKEINKTALLVVPIVGVLALSVYLFRDLGISLLYTEEFRNARELFAIQLIGDVIKIVSWLYAYPMISRGAAKWYISSEILMSLLFVGLSYFFVSLIGIKGVPVAYTISYVGYFIFVFFNVKKFSI